MWPIKDQNLSQLFIQLRFTPEKKRVKLLKATEELYYLIQDDKQYPFDFVCFRITGYHPKSVSEQPLIKGDKLADDLRNFICKLSSQLDCRAGDEKQKVYSIERLTKKLDVSTKTIERWRKRGLLARRFIFDDGQKKLGFLQSALDNFFRNNPNIVTRAKNYNRMRREQRRKIIKRTSELAARTKLSRYQLIKRVAKETGRAHETVRYTIIDYENSHPSNPIFKKPSGVIQPVQAAEMYKLFKQGSSIRDLMTQFNRSRSSIYRLINFRRARELLMRKIDFINSEEFLQEDAQDKILGEPLLSSQAKSGSERREFELAGETLLPEYLQRVKDTPVLDRKTEINLFRRYNYLKYLACVRRTGIKPTGVKSSRIEEIEDYLAQAEKIKEMIIEANLRLVISIALKHTGSGANLSDLVSDGNVSLMGAVENFDYTRGVRFVSRASWAIMRGYARKVPARKAGVGKAKTASMADISHDLRAKEAVNVVVVEQAHKSLTDMIKQELDEREEYVILNHFGLIGSTVKKKKKTLKQVGDDLGLTKERVRQLELVALQKLRRSLSPEQFELLKG